MTLPYICDATGQVMNEPWFRCWFWFSFGPIRWQGWAATAIVFGAELPFVLLLPRLARDSLLWWAAGLTAGAIFLCCFALVVWKTDQRFGRQP
jgi:hypothetical protein